MAEVIFNYEGRNTKIQCNIKEKMNDIIDRFLIKSNNIENKNNLFYLYNGTKINSQLIFNEQANNLDKERKKMNIIVFNNKNKNKIEHILSKDIISLNVKKML